MPIDVIDMQIGDLKVTNTTQYGLFGFFDSLESGFKHKIKYTILIYVVVQAILGIVAIEYSLCKLSRFMEKNNERDEKFPHFRRYDSQYWARWKLYPGAMFLMPTRIALLVFDGIFLTSMVT